MSRSIFRSFTLGGGNASAAVGPMAMILSAVDRLRKTLDEENNDIAGRGRVDYHAYNMRKSQGLLELKRLAPAIEGNPIGPVLRDALIDLQAKLETNSHLLRTQLDAAKAVAEIIARAIRESQSDGTYSPNLVLDEEE
jgi:hypothetical protein